MSEARGKFLHQLQSPDQRRTFARGELAREKFGDDVVDIENHPRAGQSRQPCGEHHEVGNVVDVNEVEAAARMAASQPPGGGEEKSQKRPEIGSLRLGIFAEAILDAEQLDAGNDFLLRHLRSAAQREHFDVVTPGGQRLGITDHAIVTFVKRVRDHANAFAFAGRKI
jgi:hypothetical protein